MAHFFGSVQGNRGRATRTAGKGGLVTQAAGWGGCILTEIIHRDGKDYYRVTLRPWQSSGGDIHMLAEGELRA